MKNLTIDELAQGAYAMDEAMAEACWDGPDFLDHYPRDGWNALTIERREWWRKEVQNPLSVYYTHLEDHE